MPTSFSSLALWPLFFTLLFASCSKKSASPPHSEPKKERVVRSCIYGGEAVENGHCGESSSYQTDPFPFAVAIGHRFAPFFCSGVLIHPQVVLTAAHCIEKIQEYDLNPSDLYVYFGAGFVSTEILPFTTIKNTREVKAVHIHPDYHPQQPQIDLGLVILAAPVREIPPVKLLQVQSFSEFGHLLTPGVTMTTIGFGLIEDKPSLEEFYGTKHHVALTLENLSDHEVVLKGQGRDICPGDSGGPVLLKDQALAASEWKLVAINSRGLEGCGKRGHDYLYRGYYSLVPNQFAYIHQVMRENQVPLQ